MRTIKIKKLYMGTAPIREHFLNEDITIFNKETEETMSMLKDEIPVKRGEAKIKEIVVRDNFGRNPEKLVYFTWKSDKNLQQSLL